MLNYNYKICAKKFMFIKQYLLSYKYFYLNIIIILNNMVILYRYL